MDTLLEALAWYFFEYPVFGLGNLFIATLMWTMAGRFLLGLFVPEDWDNYIWRFFRRLTDPVLAVVRRITPSFMVEALLPLVAIWWLIVARLGWWWMLRSIGLAPAL